MISIKEAVPVVTVRALLLAAAVICMPQIAAAGRDMPPSVAALSPASVQLSIQSYNVYSDDEFGNSISAQLHGSFTEFPRCAYAAGPEFDIQLSIDPAWEASPGQLATWEEMFLSELDWEGVPDSLVESVGTKITEAAGTPVVGTPVVEDLPNGHIAYVEFDWKCAANSGGANTLLQGYALRGATSLQFSYWIYAGREKAVAMAIDIFAKFKKMDLAALRK